MGREREDIDLFEQPYASGMIESWERRSLEDSLCFVLFVDENKCIVEEDISDGEWLNEKKEH